MIGTNITSNTSRVEHSKKVYLIIAVVAVVVLVGGYFGITKLVSKSSNSISGVNGGLFQKSDTFWAVFLTNGQTYFGKLDPDDLNGNYVELSNVYYLEKSTAASTPTAGADSNTPAPAQAGGYNLIHLGNELHAPTDKMIINREQVLFVEQLKPESQVVKLIGSQPK